MQAHLIPTDPTPEDLAPLKIEFHRVITQAESLAKAIAERDPRYAVIQRKSLYKAKLLTEPIRWGYECKVVRWNGRTFTFTDAQAEVVRILRRQREAGFPRVKESSIINILGIDTGYTKQQYRLICRFKGHPAMGVMIFNDYGWWWLGE